MVEALDEADRAPCAVDHTAHLRRVRVGAHHVDAQPQGGRTALMLAAMFDRVDIVELLLAHGARTALAGADGATALDLARGMDARRAAARLSE